jgi:nitroreductase
MNYRDPMDVFDAMGTAVSMRWLKPDPVPKELIDKLLWAATRASSPGNVQPWDFVVVGDATIRRELGEVLSRRMSGLRQRSGGSLPDDPTQRRMIQGATHLVEHLGEAPLLILVCGRNVYPPNAPQEHMMYSAVFGAAQNLMVAARALGLGAAYTTFQLGNEAEINDILGIPQDVKICVTIPVGWPDRSQGSLTRKPLEDVVHYDGW